MTRSTPRRLLVAITMGLALVAPASAVAQDPEPEHPIVGIVGGSFVAPGQYPWMVALVASGSPSAHAGIFCGGAVVAPRVVLTAAHCLEDETPEAIDVVAGRTLLSNRVEGQRVHASALLTHPRYNSERASDDIALVQLAEPVSVKPIEVAAPGLARAGSPVASSGWGTTSENGSVSNALKAVRMNIRPASACGRLYPYFRTSQQLCAGAKRGGQDTCQGDSGGPLFSGNDAGAQLLGVVSYGYGCGREGIPGVYTRVRHFGRWLSDNTARLNAGAAVPPPAPRQPRVRIGAIRCGVKVCTVQLRVNGRAPAGGIRIDAIRGRQGKRKAVHRRAFATNTSGRWVARIDIPLGRVRLYATPLDGFRSGLDGAGDVARLIVTGGD